MPSTKNQLAKTSHCDRFYSIKVKGFGGFSKEVLFSPFGKFPLLIPVNILFRVVEDIAKPISLALRLFGNTENAERVSLIAWSG